MPSASFLSSAWDGAAFTVRANGLRSVVEKALLLCTAERFSCGTELGCRVVRTGLRDKVRPGGHDRAQVEATSRVGGRVNAYIMNGTRVHQHRGRRGNMNIHREQQRRRGLQLHITTTGRDHRPTSILFEAKRAMRHACECRRALARSWQLSAPILTARRACRVHATFGPCGPPHGPACS